MLSSGYCGGECFTACVVGTYVPSCVTAVVVVAAALVLIVVHLHLSQHRAWKEIHKAVKAWTLWRCVRGPSFPSPSCSFSSSWSSLPSSPHAYPPTFFFEALDLRDDEAAGCSTHPHHKARVNFSHRNGSP